MNHWLTILTLIPFFGGIVVAGLGAEQKNLVRGLAPVSYTHLTLPTIYSV